MGSPQNPGPAATMGRPVSRPTVEVLTGATGWATVGAALLLTTATIVTVDDVAMRWGLVALGPAAGAAAVIDAKTHRIPTRLAVASGVIAVSGCIAVAITDKSWTPMVAGLVASIVVSVVFLALWRFTGLGLGDVRLAAALAPLAGAVGWQAVAAFVVATHLLAVPLALWALARRRRDIPFGPAIVAGLYAAGALTPML